MEYIKGMVRGSSKKEEGNKTRLQARVRISLWRASPTGCFLVDPKGKGWVCLFVSKLGRPFSYCIVSYDSFRRFYSFILGGRLLWLLRLPLVKNRVRPFPILYETFPGSPSSLSGLSVPLRMNYFPFLSWKEKCGNPANQIKFPSLQANPVR